MKDLLSKEHYCCKTHTSLTKTSAFPLLKTTPYMDYPPFLQEKFDPPPFFDFSKI